MSVAQEEACPKEENILKKFVHKHILKQPESYAKKKNYIFGKTLGAGSFGVVRQARRLSTSEDVAIKILLKDALNETNLQMLYDELQILESCHHENIVAFKDWFESRDKFFIVTQLAIGGELFDRIVQRGSFTESDAIAIVEQILSALTYLHSKNIVHRDLKPENILYLNRSGDNKVVLADFGIAKKLEHPQDLIYKAAGSMGYVAPEVLTKRGHGKPCDIWSLGVITYTLLSGYSPFMAESVDGFMEEICTGPEPVVFHAPYWNTISKEAKFFIKKCCTVDPDHRPTAKELLEEDPWILSLSKKDGQSKVAGKEEHDLLPHIKQSISPKLKLQKAIQVVMLNNKIKSLKEKYGIVDEDHDIDNTEGQSKSAVDGENLADDSQVNSDAQAKSIRLLQNQIRQLSLKEDEASKNLRKDITQAAFANLVEFATLQKDYLMKQDNEETTKQGN